MDFFKRSQAKAVRAHAIGIAATGAALSLLASGSPLTSRSVAAQGAPGVPVNPVSVDVRALGNDGRPLRDLRPEDVVLRLDGRTRTVRSLQRVDLTLDQVDTGAIPAAPPFSTNLASEAGRSFVIVFDDESVKPGEERRTQEALVPFLSELPARDRLALITVPHGGIVVDFTTDRAKVRRAFAALTGQAPQVPVSGPETACRTRAVLYALADALDSLGGGAGPTTVIFMSSGLVGPRSEQLRRAAPVGTCELTPDDFNRVANSAAHARAELYVVVPEQIMPPTEAPAPSTAQFGGVENPLAGLEHLTGLTGGNILHLATSHPDAALGRIARETSVYYVLTFEPDPGERNGNPHRLDIRVARPDTTIRALPLITIPKPDARPADAGVKTPLDILHSPRGFERIRLRAAASSSQVPGESRLKVLVDFEAVDPTVSLTAAAAGLFDASGRLVAQWIARPGDLAETPRLGAMLAPPGSYRLRVAGIDASGRTGAVDADVTVELTRAGPLQLSSMLLGLSRPTGFSPRLQFSTEPVALAYLEIYGGQPNTAVAAAFEVSTSLNGAPLVAVPGVIAATGEAGRYTVTGAIPVGALPPGDFVVRGIVGAQGEAAGRVVRTLRKIR